MTSDDTERAAVRVAAEIHEGIDAVRLSGLVNMLDRPTVARIAAAMGYARCARWVQDNRQLYARGVFHGFTADGGGEGTR